MLSEIFVTAYLRVGGRTLMLKRSKQDDQVGRYNGLGGKVELGESPQEGMIREVKEESGLIVQRYRMSGLVTITVREKMLTAILFIFEAWKYKGEMIDRSLEGQLQWVKNSDLRKLNTNKGDHLIFDWLDEKRFFSGRIERNVGGDLLDFAVDYY
ncbi:MAG: NUDIX hydrolase [Patescibacteria group bacterium]